MVTPLLLSKNISYDILDGKSLTDVFTRVHQHLGEKGSFPSVNTMLNVKYSEMWRKMKTLLTW